MATKWPLNTDGRTWALEEIEKLNKQNEALKNALSNKPPDIGPPEPDPKQQERIQQLTDRIEELEQENEKLREELRSRL
jgi:pyruvate/2-oxoacid:ferredoxin oxidoreductase beta subunit